MSCTNTAKELISLLKKRGEQVTEIVRALSNVWARGEQRLRDIASSDALLAREMLGGNRDGRVRAVQAEVDGDEGRSSFSEFSLLSASSAKSARSDVSSSSSIASNPVSESAFSVTGIDHALLSRGGNVDDGFGSRANFPPKRRSRRVKGEGKDVWGLRQEMELCDKLWAISDVKALAEGVVDCCAALIIVGGRREASVANHLHESMQEFVNILYDHPTPSAPPYPGRWLSARDMDVLKRFQKDGAGLRTNVLPTWWDVVELGVSRWDELKLVCLL